LEMLLTGRRLNAQEAYKAGLVNRVVPREELLPTTEEIARKIASYSKMAVRIAKQATIRGLDLTLNEGLELEKRLATLNQVQGF